MRTFLSGIVAACAATLLLAPAAANAEPAPRLKITHNTSAIYQSDPSLEGNGPLFDTVQVYAQLRNCPAGDYLRDVTLVQDGVSYPWATQAMGAGEVICNATETDPPVGMVFFGNGLHPGTAVVTVTITSFEGVVLAQDSRTVRIPAGDNQP